jgi:hypothetical protein
MNEPVYKLIELTGTSATSIEDAVDKASKWWKHGATSKREKCITGR